MGLAVVDLGDVSGVEGHVLGDGGLDDVELAHLVGEAVVGREVVVGALGLDDRGAGELALVGPDLGAGDLVAHAGELLALDQAAVGLGVERLGLEVGLPVGLAGVGLVGRPAGAGELDRAGGDLELLGALDVAGVGAGHAGADLDGHAVGDVGGGDLGRVLGPLLAVHAVLDLGGLAVLVGRLGGAGGVGLAVVDLGDVSGVEGHVALNGGELLPLGVENVVANFIRSDLRARLNVDLSVSVS